MILTPAVEWLLERVPRIEGNPWVIAGQNPGDHLKNLDAIWLRLRKRAGLDDVRIHDCRHSYASRALAIGEAIPLISEVLGHRKFSTTARYAHLARDGERASAAKVGDSIGETSSHGTRARRHRSDSGMAKFRTKTISRRTVEALKVEKDTVFWDRELTGFGVRVYPSGRKVYIAQARAKGKAAQRVTVAPHGVISPEEARRRAALMVSRIKAGEEPVPEPLSATLAKGPTVADIARRYLEDHVAVRCRPRTAEFYRTAVEKYLVPRLGKLSALAVDHARVTELHHALRDKPVMANKVVETLSRIYNAAEDRGLIPEASNPCGLVVKNRERKRERCQ